jgi:hypothetical protein
MLACSGGSASKLRPAKQALTLAKTSHLKQILAPEEGDIRPPKSLRFAPIWGCRKPELIAQWLRHDHKVQKSEGAYVEDHHRHFHATANPNHGCNECSNCTDRDRQGRANDLAQPRAPRSNRLQEIVMAKVVEFYIPTNFRKPLRTSAQPQLGKIIAFCSQTKRSA